MPTNRNPQSEGRPILVIGADDFAACPECARRLDVAMNDAGGAPAVMERDNAGPIHCGTCPDHGAWRFQVEPEKPEPPILCAHCGNDGSRAALFLSIDARWKPDAGAWELQERDDAGGVNLDCLECDGQTACERAAIFPYGLLLQPPGAPLSVAADLANQAAELLRHLRAVQSAFNEPHYGDRDQQADSVFDALEAARPVLDALAHIQLLERMP